MAGERLTIDEVWAAFKLLERREKGCVDSIMEEMAHCDRKLFDSLVQAFPDQIPWAMKAGREEHELCALTLAAALIALRDSMGTSKSLIALPSCILAKLWRDSNAFGK